MSLRLKFNIVLLFVFVCGIGAAGYTSYRFLHERARDEVAETAGSMMAAAMAVRTYTVDQIRPRFEKVQTKTFPAQTVPAFAATEVFERLRKDYPDFTYKEATLNPTNPRDRAMDWENDIVIRFRNFPESREILGERDTPIGRSLYLARPIKISNQSCLECHSTPAAAPKVMVETYGDKSGFGWKLDEIVGAQIVSVPMDLAGKKADRAFYVYMTSLVAIFAAVFLVLNVMLGRIVIRPLVRLSRLADQVSTGAMDLPEFDARSRDEIGQLGGSFNRMRRSLEKAMSMLNE